MKYLFIFLTFLAFDCEDVKDTVKQQVERQALDELAKEIKLIADGSICSTEYSCDFIGFGSKSCGGYWEYLVYSNSIDVVELMAKVEIYNRLEKEYNKKWNIVSDCMVVMPPDGTVCEDGKCKAVYN